MLASFITEPEGPVFMEENSTKELVWELVDCDWQVRVLSDSFRLHPNLLPLTIPIKMNTDYNVTEICVDDRKVVRFSIVFNEHVLNTSIEYVVCKIFRTDSPNMVKKSQRVNFTNSMPSLSTFNTETDTYTTTEPKSSSYTTAKMPTTTGSACNLSTHFITLTIGLIIANLVLSFVWIF